MTEFEPFPKIPRLNKGIVVTEKIDGTNGTVFIDERHPFDRGQFEPVTLHYGPEPEDQAHFAVYAGSRKRWITPEDDNHGFAAWVYENATELVRLLGTGWHRGEWWGSGINRGYDLPNGEKRFSLFNVKKWADTIGHWQDTTDVKGLRTVPVLARWHRFDSTAIDATLDDLRNYGSYAVDQYRNPEGVVVYHTAGNHLYKVLLENDHQPKSVSGTWVNDSALYLSTDEHEELPTIKEAVLASMERRN